MYAGVEAAHASVSELNPLPANPDTNFLLALSQSKQLV